MTGYRNAPIRQKLLAVIVTTTAMALTLAGAGVFILDSVLFRRAMERDLQALANIVGENSTAALEFMDARVANETLAALRARPYMVSACLYQADGAVFARYARPNAPEGCPRPAAKPGISSVPGALLVTHPVMVTGKRVGTLAMLYDGAEVSERATYYGAIVVLILIGASLFAVGFSSRMREAITHPISRLARAAATVSESGDYAVRVKKETGDELGVLVDAFNEMLQRIQARDVEVQNARNSLETTLTSIGDAVIATDVEGRISFANPVAKALLRWKGPDISGKPIGEVFRIVNEFTRQKVDSPVEKVLRTGAISGLANHTLLIAQDGTEVPIDDSAAPIAQDGRTFGVVLVFRDISERRRAQQDAGFLAAIVESSDDAIIGKSPEGIIRTWNDGASRLYGYTAEEAIGRPMMELVPEDRKHEESDILERMRSGNRVVHFETVRMRKDGSPMDVSLTISPVRDKSGHLAGISHVARDITEQKRTAEQIRQTQKLESLGVLAGGIAHDFNNLLTGILGNASLALEDLPPGSRAKDPLDSVVIASERAAQLAQQMLAYSGKGRFVVEDIRLSAKIREILPLIRASIPPRIELRLDLDDQLPEIEADAAQLQQLIMNVIINGAEAVPEGERGTLTITTHSQNVENGYAPSGNISAGELTAGPHVLFGVADTGCGMDEATLARIFDPFFTTKFTGRGLGLAAVLGIVRGHHGTVEVSSSPRNGTTFRFLFPALAAARGERDGPPEGRAPELHGSGTVLVVDDEPVVRNVALKALERYGYAVLVAANGSEGVEVFRREARRISCVVLDLTMPVMGGEEALEQMKAIRSDVPIILSSGFNEAQAVQRFEGKGLAGFIQKPYRASSLLEKIAGVLGHSYLNRA